MLISLRSFVLSRVKWLLIRLRRKRLLDYALPIRAAKSGMAFELKGGTSLSKGFGIIHRFSEDIDIRIEPPEHVFPI